MPKVINIDKEKMMHVMLRLDFFEHFSTFELKKLLMYNSQFLLYEKGEFVIKKDDNDEAFFIVLDGVIYITTDNKVLSKIEAGNFFGEIAFLTKEPRTANAVASQRCLILRVDRNLLDHVHHKVKDKIKDKIIARLIKNIKQMNLLLDTK